MFRELLDKQVVLQLSAGGGGSGFTPVYGGYYQTTNTDGSVVLSTIGTVYNLGVDTITAKDGNTNLTVVAGGGLRNTGGSAGTFKVTGGGGVMFVATFCRVSLGARVRETDDTTYKTNAVGFRTGILTGGDQTNPRWTVYLDIEPNETVFPTVVREDGSSVTLFWRYPQFDIERIA